ncbi:hypothetical protein [Actinomyces ruminicola]|uniref:RDD family protein n=1 Tax=Actinomyces ruminicola TaxID=332524 RepID=A0A1G9Z8W0_9ACTO|nr:hypothetical protein [Actinomyces ruminicola]SDN17577.1 hypothetical protein SAMN04487766_11646 [Actinomyces ruminicola]
MVAAGIGIDLAIVAVPLVVGLLLSGPALLRLLLVLAALGLLLAQLVGHCLYGRAAGGLLLGLLTVDAEAGLPTGTARALLAVVRLGSAAGATVLDIHNGPDPSRVTLDELDELAEAAELSARAQQLAAASSPSPQPVQPQPVQPQPQQPQPRQPEQAPATAALPPESPPALRAVPAQPPSAQTPPMTPMPLPPSVPPQAPPPPPPPEPAQHPAAAAAPQAPAPPRMTRKELRAREREQERARARQALSFPDAQAPGPERMVG